MGDTSQEAIAGALKLALRHVSTRFHAAEVEHIELTQYPWFYLARVRVYPYRIQQDAELAETVEAEQITMPERQRRLPPQAAEMFLHFGSAMPMLKEMLILSRSSEASDTMTMLQMTILMLVVYGALRVPREPVLSRARSRCNSR